MKQEKHSLETIHWLQQRQKLGNWFDVSDADVIPFDISGPMRTVLHMFQLAISPEIRRRLVSKELDDGFILSAAQNSSTFNRTLESAPKRRDPRCCNVSSYPFH